MVFDVETDVVDVINAGNGVVDITNGGHSPREQLNIVINRIYSKYEIKVYKVPLIISEISLICFVCSIIFISIVDNKSDTRSV